MHAENQSSNHKTYTLGDEWRLMNGYKYMVVIYHVCATVGGDNPAGLCVSSSSWKRLAYRRTIIITLYCKLFGSDQPLHGALHINKWTGLENLITPFKELMMASSRFETHSNPKASYNARYQRGEEYPRKAEKIWYWRISQHPRILKSKNRKPTREIRPQKVDSLVQRLKSFFLVGMKYPQAKTLKISALSATPLHLPVCAEASMTTWKLHPKMGQAQRERGWKTFHSRYFGILFGCIELSSLAFVPFLQRLLLH